MPFLHKFTSPLFKSRSSPSREPESNSPRPCSSVMVHAPVNEPAQVEVQTQTHKAPAQQEPNFYPRNANPSSSVQESQFLWEDINPPAGLEHLVSNQSEATFSASQSLSSASLHSQTATQTPTMISQTTSPEESSPSLPLYNDVSGAVVVDAEGYPRFLTPQEQQDREDTLQRAVRERMMGLPRNTEFNWEASGGPVLPRYEPPPAAGAEAGGGEKR
ncbi:hypothetical protein BDV06DRAFT_188751 [Aspergillus oleicola]